MSTRNLCCLIIAFALGVSGTASAIDYNGDLPSYDNIDIGTDWAIQADVRVQPETVAGNLPITVNVVSGSATMDALTISSASYGSGADQNVSLVFNSSGGTIDAVFTQGATLTGSSAGSFASLVLTGSGAPVTVSVTGETALNGNASLTLGGTGDVNYLTDSLVLQGAFGANTVTIGAGTTLETGVLSMSGAATNRIDIAGNLNLTSATVASTIESGTMQVTGNGTVTFNKLTASSSDSEIVLAGGKLAFGGTGAALSLATGGSLRVTTASTIEGRGTVNVGTGSTLAIGANLTASDTSFVSEGTTNISSVAVLKGRDFDVAGGETTVSGNAEARMSNSFAVSGGKLIVNGTIKEIDGDVDGFTFTQTAGETTISAAGTLTGVSTAAISGGTFTVNNLAQAQTFAVSGSANVLVGSGGTIEAAAFGMTGGTATIGKGGYLDLTAEGDADAPEGSLSIAGGRLEVSGWVDTGTMTLGGGGTVVVNAYDSGANGVLNVAHAVSNAQGSLLLYGGVAQFQGGASFDNGGLVASYASGSRVIGDLTMKSGSTLNTEAASLAITGNLVLGGTYRAGFSGGQNTIVSVVGDATFAETTDIRLTTALMQSIADGGDNRILASGSTSGTLTPHYQQGAWFFSVQMRSDGLYVEGLRPVSLTELIAYMYEEWNAHPKVKGNADKLIKGDFAGVVLQASLDYVDPDVYPVMTLDGRQNALNLFAIGEGPSVASYSGLMLYNGAGLSSVNQANIDAARQSVAGLDRRIGSLRHEIAANTQDVCLPGRDQEYDTYANRFWVDFSLARMRENWDQGFAGYDYDPRNLTIGYDRLFDRFALGAAFNYGFGDFKDRAAERSDSTINSYTFSAYGLYAAESGWYASGSVGYTYYDNSIKDYRTLGHAGSSAGWNRADYNATGWQFAGALGYELEVLDYFNLTPSVGLRHVRARSESHSQKFSPTGGQTYKTLLAGEVKGHSTTLPVELAASYDIFGEKDSVLSISGMVGYAYEMNGDGATGSVRYAGLDYPSVKIVSHSPGRNIFNTGLGLNYVNDRYQIGLDYRYAKRSEYSSHDLNGSFSLMF